MASIEQSDRPDLARASTANRLAAIAMAVSTAALLVLLRPELSLVYLSYAGISVGALSLIRHYGLLVHPRPIKQQNFAAYVSVSTLGFMATLIAAPQLLELHVPAIYVLISILMAGLLLRAIFKSL